MDKVTQLCAEANALARQLPDPRVNAQVAHTLMPGAAGRKRSGIGEQFWQYRRYAQTDAAERIDWRRSARGDELFVRESELETARTILFWSDHAAGFDWASDTALPTKADRARLIMLAVAILLSKSGERVGSFVPGRKAKIGRQAADALAEDLVMAQSARPIADRRSALAVLASDFYQDISTWSEQISQLSKHIPHGILLCVSDPVEERFPFEGRVKFSMPGSDLFETIGRSETVRDTYLQRLSEHREALGDIAARAGWSLIPHSTAEDPKLGASQLLAALEQFGAKA